MVFGPAVNVSADLLDVPAGSLVCSMFNSCDFLKAQQADQSVGRSLQRLNPVCLWLPIFGIDQSSACAVVVPPPSPLDPSFQSQSGALLRQEIAFLDEDAAVAFAIRLGHLWDISFFNGHN